MYGGVFVRATLAQKRHHTYLLSVVGATWTISGQMVRYASLWVLTRKPGAFFLLPSKMLLVDSSLELRKRYFLLDFLALTCIGEAPH